MCAELSFAVLGFQLLRSASFEGYQTFRLIRYSLVRQSLLTPCQPFLLSLPDYQIYVPQDHRNHYRQPRLDFEKPED